MKRFYKEVAVFASPLEGEAASRSDAVGGVVVSDNTPPRNSLHEFRRSPAVAGSTLKGRVGFFILLDGKSAKTPARAPLALPTRALAEAIAEEWRRQGESVRPQTMPLSKLANSAIDRVAGREAEVAEQILAYANDLLCYRAAAPAELVARQNARWDPLLEWVAGRYAPLAVGTGIAHVPQTDETLAAYRRALAVHDAFALAALHNAATVTGSLVLALALAEARLDARQAFALSRLDEAFQAEKWGADAEAESRACALETELVAAERFIRLAKHEPAGPHPSTSSG
jgi:chaperone required for assembly of F1-ATPase